MSDVLKKLSDLDGMNFYVPDYQRGYRWTDVQVENLLEDLEAFAKQKDQESFFLEPIVVTKGDGAHCYELIDGQQRLTTLFLLGHVLEKRFNNLGMTPVNFNLLYPASRGTLAFLGQIASDPLAGHWDGEDGSPDFHCIANACRRICNKVAEPSKQKIYLSILTGLPDQIKFLWHDTSEENIPASETFERLNTGKIALTDGELCRSLLLVRQNIEKELPSLKGYSEDEKQTLMPRLRRTLIDRRQIIQSNNWDEGEKLLANEDLWEFFGNPLGYQTRMDFVLNLHYSLRPGYPGHYVCFEKLYADTNPADNKAVDGYAVWGEIKQTLQRLQDWYNDQDYYHWIGYLSRVDKRNLQELLKLSQKVSADKFKDSVIQMIRESININDYDLDSIQYVSGTDRDTWKILFLFNVEYSRTRKLAFARFPFSKFTPDQSIEHISARNLGAPKEIELKIEWLNERIAFLGNLKFDEFGTVNGEDGAREILEEIPEVEGAEEKANRERAVNSLEFDRQKLLESADSLLKNYSGVKNLAQAADLVDEFNQLYNGFEEFMSKIEANEDVNSLYNLCLIDKDINASFGNKEFLGKQEKMRHILAAGARYVPPATQALFMRHFMEKGFNCSWWTKDDRSAYRKMLHKTLSLFWPEFIQRLEGNTDD